MTEKRLLRLRSLMAEDNLDAMFVAQPENRRYLSGFTGSAGVLIITPERALLATDFRYYEQVRQQAPDFTLVQVTGKVAPALASTTQDLDLKRVGFESHVLTVEEYETWKAEMPGITWVPTSGRVESLREIKDSREMSSLEEAVRLADEAMQHVYDWIRPGVTEKQVAWELEVYMRTRGADNVSFDTIVAAGKRGAMSHAVPTDRSIEQGEPVVIDMGARYEGYCSDMTRSFCIGEATEAYVELWNLVLRAQEAAEEGIHGGISGKEADAIARRIICAAGYEDKFGHGLGHGVGLAIHEGPRASVTAEAPIRAGSVVTVEPGIYDPGWCGIRIEDMVHVTEDGCRVLTQCPKLPVVGR